LFYQIAEVGIELGCATCNINGVGGGLIESLETGFNCGSIHTLFAIGTRINMTMPTGHITELANIDLKDF
jgi:hypothetical protein